MRLTLKKKIVVGLGAILLIGLGSMLVIYRGLDIVGWQMHELAEIGEPASAAAYEMEVNASGMGLALLKYLDDGKPKGREQVESNSANFESFHTRYRGLIESKEEIDLANDLDARFRDFKILGASLMNAQETRETVIGRIDIHMSNIDRIVNGELQPNSEQVSSTCAKLEAHSQMEIEMARLGRAFADYRASRQQQRRERLIEQQARFRRTVAVYEDLPLSAREAHGSAAVRAEFGQSGLELDRLLSLDELLQRKIDRFIGLHVEIDGLLDDKVQVLALRNLYIRRQEADDAIQDVLRIARFIVPLFVLSGLGVAALFVRTVTAPLLELRRGTEAIGRGDLSHRIVATGGDEYADLARQFNRMVVQLQVSTVSKELLEASEEELHKTVADLRREIDERERGEQERAQLQAALRHSETMSAMGALVAGVAHEVRNPLFGISSTLDAMDARFAGREEHQRYSEALRAAVERMTKLMSDLLLYGKPTMAELVPSSVNLVVAQAIKLCMPVAEPAHVELVEDVEPDLPLVNMDCPRLLQVFHNIIENAIQHSPPGGRIRISTKLERGGWIVCSVEDSGRGFDPMDLEHVFEPFFTRRRGGTGLGLSIVARILDEHRGVVHAENRSEGGAIITVRLPAAS